MSEAKLLYQFQGICLGPDTHGSYEAASHKDAVLRMLQPNNSPGQAVHVPQKYVTTCRDRTLDAVAKFC